MAAYIIIFKNIHLINFTHRYPTTKLQHVHHYLHMRRDLQQSN